MQQLALIQKLWQTTKKCSNPGIIDLKAIKTSASECTGDGVSIGFLFFFVLLLPSALTVTRLSQVRWWWGQVCALPRYRSFAATLSSLIILQRISDVLFAQEPSLQLL